MNLVLQIDDKLDSIYAYLIDDERAQWIETKNDQKDEDGDYIDSRNMRILLIDTDDPEHDWSDISIPGNTLEKIKCTSKDGSFIIDLKNQTIDKVFIGVSY